MGAYFRCFPKRLIYLSNLDIRMYVVLRLAGEQVLRIISPLADFLVPATAHSFYSYVARECSTERHAK